MSEAILHRLTAPCPAPAPSLLVAALDYHRRGWSTVPIRRGSKSPAVPWKRYQRERPSLRCVERWYARADVGGIAVITGGISGGLGVRDYDTEDAYRQWAEGHPALATTLPTVRTARGWHVYLTLATEQYVTLPDGELRGTGGHYVVAPPSAHPDGAVYTWTNPLPDAGAPPLLDPVAVGFCPPPGPCRRSGGAYHAYACVYSSTWLVRNVSEITRATLPSGPGQRNNRLWELARRLRGIPELRDAPADVLEPVVCDWWSQALAHIRTREWEATWSDWCGIWPRVRHPAGASLAGIGQVLSGLVPRVPFEETLAGDLLRLELVCEELDRRHEGKPFPLSVRIAGRLIGTSYAWAARLLRRLVRAGVLEMVQEGDRKAKLARVWRYCGPKILRLSDGPGVL